MLKRNCRAAAVGASYGLALLLVGFTIYDWRFWLLAAFSPVLSWAGAVEVWEETGLVGERRAG